MSISGMARHPLGFFPTPLQELSRLGAELGGPRLFIKRDDQTGLALGGNKTRKLEFLVGDALAHGCDTLITGGATQSNHCRQTAAAAAACGLECHLVLGGEAPEQPQGNLLLDHLFGATIHWAGDNRRGEDIPRIAEELREKGRKPYVVPYGGSSMVGAAAFVAALGELKVQAEEAGLAFSHVIFASSSAGTHAGMIVGNKLHGLGMKVIGVGIDKWEMEDEDFRGLILDLCGQLCAEVCRGVEVRREDVVLDERFVGEGYGVVGAL
ncbi:MAG: pyridoxal-phosphate dependent enzyme, partial [Hyphomicrobiales bacterium]